MNPEISSNPEEIRCNCCDYKTNRPYNLKRHIVSKHTQIPEQQKESLPQQEYSLPQQKASLVRQEDSLVQQEDSLVSNDCHPCDKCSKTFAKQWILARHAKTCKGMIERLVCDYCRKSFLCSSSKYRHHKICKVRIEKDSKALTLSTNANAAANANVASTINNNTTNNIHNVGGNNIENQTVINLVVYNPKPGEPMQFNHNHIDQEQLGKFLIQGDKVPPEQLTNAVREWTQQLLSHDDNKCVKKTNIRASHSRVHVGNNNWESRLDKEVYPHLMNNIANDFSDYFGEKYRTSMYKSLEAFIDYMASDGYCSNDSDKRIESSYKTLVKELKLRTFDNTKRESDTGQAALPGPEIGLGDLGLGNGDRC